jgi:esterase/lipase
MAATFAAALAEIDALAASEVADPAIDPRCVSFALQHGAATKRAIVLLHGFTNCPRQFESLAQLLFEGGFNVFVPRLPRHGMLDKLTAELAGLTAAELAACGARSTQLAAGLGARTSVLGLSAGATVAAWLAQTEPLDRVVAVAPFFSVARVPSALEPALAGALTLAPNLQLWWDPRVKAKLGPDHAYPRFATHALAQCLELAQRRACSCSTRKTPRSTTLRRARCGRCGSAAPARPRATPSRISMRATTSSSRQPFPPRKPWSIPCFCDYSGSERAPNGRQSPAGRDHRIKRHHRCTADGESDP